MSRYCCKTAPMAMSEASVVIEIGALGLGMNNNEACAKASLVAEKAVSASVVQCKT